MPISEYILNARQQWRLHLRLRNKWMIRIRWYYLTILTVVVVGSTWLAGADKSLIKTYLALSMFALAANGLLWLVSLPLHFPLWYYRLIAYLQVTLDMGLATFVVYLQNGTDSRATVLYALPIMIAGVLYQPFFAYFTALISGVLYATALLLADAKQGMSAEIASILVPAAFYSSVFFILAAIVSRTTTINAQNEREKSYDELLALLRHQLHHPVSVIAAVTEMLEFGDSHKNFSEQDKRYIKQIAYENHRMHTMISNLLTAGEQTKTIPPKSINLVQLLEDSTTASAMAAKRLKDLDTRYSGQSIVVQGNVDQLSLALDNIIENAFRYSDPGTKVIIEITETKKSVQITITDHGPGISPEKQKHLFERFSLFERDNNHSKLSDLYSLGLGLYVSRLIIEAHGGSIEVQSSPKKGTSIIIKLKKGQT